MGLPDACKVSATAFPLSEIALAHMRDANHALASPRCFRVAHRCARAVLELAQPPQSHPRSVRFLSQGDPDFPTARRSLGNMLLAICITEQGY